jgi:hypothetical protein
MSLSYALHVLILCPSFLQAMPSFERCNDKRLGRQQRVSVPAAHALLWAHKRVLRGGFRLSGR